MEKELRRPTQLITRKFATELHLNFMKYRASIIAKYIKKEDANAIWFSVEELENYIHYIKTKGEKTGYDVNGIRIYFGVYPDEKKYEEKAGLMTVFLQATGKKIRKAAKEGEVQTLALHMDSGEGDVSSIEPMNYGSIGRPPSLDY
ncbi:hypothetical protein SAMN05444397_10864 [Flavobacterium aquidurense]|uniref:Phage terminase, small subunit, putative, P27 family n=1 Tax=Flavobacterium frigidimaris TaxID=262320 RepID=A0ABX4BPR7_FLAFR|nr:hypothetical protein [Flavobacterium frigidimaris]OXA78903.1 hypothetical protein B0A65_11985 [Flavobacterium frigidimaris]SDZ51559.1 hypothetical protein SAMN05444397_10864 [Flavobacterium aquidurense]